MNSFDITLTGCCTILVIVSTMAGVFSDRTSTIGFMFGGLAGMCVTGLIVSKVLQHAIKEGNDR